MPAAGSGQPPAGVPEPGAPPAINTLPDTTGEPLKIFKELEAQFSLHPLVTKYFLDDLGLENLDDFVHLFSDPSEVPEIVTSKVRDLERKHLATARIRKAWLGVKAARAQADVVKKKAAEPDDFDELLPQPELDELEGAFWSRYHVRYAPTVEPADLLVSRLSKELAKRLLTVRSVWQTRTMTHQLSTTRKRRKLGSNLEFVEDEAEAVFKRDLQTYLEMLYTLYIAYAKAGIRAVEGGTATESRTSDPTAFVVAPLEVMMRYHHRAQTQSRLLPPAQALAWLQQRDEDERTLWVEKMRSTDFPFGRIVQDAFERREAMWDLPPPPSGSNRQQQLAAAAAAAATANQANDQHGNKKKTPCPAWQRGQCREPCPQGKEHICNALLTTGKLCSLRSHGADACRNRKKLRALCN